MTPTPLHVWSGYSMGRGGVSQERLVARAARLGHKALAITDVNNLGGVTFFHKLCEEHGLVPLIGAELREGRLAVVALVESDTGYENLCRIITRIKRRQEQQAPFELQPELPADLAELQDGLVLMADSADRAGALLGAGVGRDRLHLAVDPAVQRYSQIRAMTELAGEANLRTVAAGTAKLLHPTDMETIRLLTAIRTGTTFDTAPPEELPHRQALLRDGKTIRQQLIDLPHAADNNAQVVQRCSRFRLLPRRPVFPDFDCPDGMETAAYLRQLCRDGMRRRYGEFPSELAEARLQRELRLIEKMGFSEYFLVVRDIVQYARGQGVPVAGRGSGASSIVAYCLGITNVCPLHYGMPFERFLHENREDFPDLDVDFCWRIRDDVIDYAFRRWGESNVTMVSSHICYQPKSAFRETAKALGLSDDQISRILKGEPNDLLPRIRKLSRRLHGLPQHLSVHPGGIVIGRKPIDHYVPVQRAAKGVMIAQMDKNGVEDINLVKLDLLGNRNLSTVRYATCLVRERTGREIDIETLDSADPATVETLRRAHTVGCNQLESPAMRHLLHMMQPSDTRDVMKILALIRPGAASIGMKETFIRRHRGLDPVPTGSAHADALLRDTCGVMLYEDDVMLVAGAMLGCDLSEADRFRRAVQKCRDEEQRAALSNEFIQRCRDNGIDSEYAKHIWLQMGKFNAYSFCRAHAASYAQLSYAGAYLKTHYPLEFWVSALNNNQSMYPPRVYVEQAKRAGVGFLLPDVNRSGEEFQIEHGAIRVGLNFVSALGPVTVNRILDERENRPYSSLSDLLGRTRLGREEARAMILCGALDGMNRTRPALMMEMNLYLTGRSDRHADQPMLLSADPVIPNVADDYPDLKKYFDQRQILGISVGPHLMEIYRPLLNGRTNAVSTQLPDCVGKRVRIAGVVEAQRGVTTIRDEPMLFLTLDDEHGLFEVTCFPDQSRRFGPVLKHYGPYIIHGKVENQYDAVTVTAERIEAAKTIRDSIPRSA
ncbi:MAG: DNA polymerase III subunit alpha [Phycisphaerae bacterium]